MNASRRTAAVLLAGLLPLLSLGPSSVHPAEEKAAQEPADSLGLPINPRAGVQLRAAADYAEEEDWKDAVRLLQHLLDGKRGELARIVGRDDKTERYASIHAEAERLLSTLPEAGRAYYRRTHGPAAAQLLEQARMDRDAELFARIVRRYLYTDAGPDALRELARQHYRAGQRDLAARNYAKLFEHLGLARWPTDDLYQATVAFQHTHAYADHTRKQLLARSRGNSIRLNDRQLTVEQLRKEIGPTPPSRRPAGWPIYRGNAARSAQSAGGPPFFESIWRSSLLHGDPKGSAALERINKAMSLMQARNQPIIPAFAPLITTVTRGEKKIPLLLYKDYWGITVRNVKTGGLVWASPSIWSLERLRDPSTGSSKQRFMVQGLNFYIAQNQFPQILFENSTVGTLSTDGRFVYAVEDLAVPLPQVANINMGFNPNTNASDYSPEVQDAISHSRLQVFELRTGKLVWELGDGDAMNPLSHCYFLGPPLPLDGLLYLLVEKGRRICLACLDPDAKFKVVSFQPLIRTPDSLEGKPYRRIQAAPLAYGDGILVCPTNAGALVGVDLRSGDLAWAYPYREKSDQPQQTKGNPWAGRRGRRGTGWIQGPNGQPVTPMTGHENRWKASSPIVSEGRIVFTPPDAASIHCLNLRDGSLIWSRKKREDELYLGGVFHGNVLIVGTNSVRGLSLASGDTLWTLETGIPSGRGIASDNVYYLPLKKSIRSKQPEICAIDATCGRIVSHIPSRPQTAGGTLDVPGNLLFFADVVISLTATEIVAYPQLKVKIARMDERLARNPNDPASVIERAVLRLQRNDLLGAVEDLRHALKQNPDKNTRRRARSLLFQALTDLFQRDIHQADKYLRQYEELCNVDVKGLLADEVKQRRAEQQRRRVAFLLLVARLRESQGRVKDALKAYLDLLAFGPGDELVPLPAEPAVKVRRDVWIRGQISGLFKRATPEQRKQLEESR